MNWLQNIRYKITFDGIEIKKEYIIQKNINKKIRSILGATKT